jgi:hypothetical protein
MNASVTSNNIDMTRFPECKVYRTFSVHRRDALTERYFSENAELTLSDSSTAVAGVFGRDNVRSVHATLTAATGHEETLGAPPRLPRLYVSYHTLIPPKRGRISVKLNLSLIPPDVS